MGASSNTTTSVAYGAATALAGMAAGRLYFVSVVDVRSFLKVLREKPHTEGDSGVTANAFCGMVAVRSRIHGAFDSYYYSRACCRVRCHARHRIDYRRNGHCGHRAVH